LAESEHHPLILAGLVVRVFEVSLQGQVAYVHGEDRGGDSGLEEESIEEVGAVTEFRSSHGVLKSLCEAVVREIMARDEG
tara:strand:- start:5169 stop:5408 length:240 start_codon:yes stop_codon:yes gene_type:complete